MKPTLKTEFISLKKEGAKLLNTILLYNRLGSIFPQVNPMTHGLCVPLVPLAKLGLYGPIQRSDVWKKSESDQNSCFCQILVRCTP